MIKVSDAHVLRDVSYASYAKEVAAINEGIRSRSRGGSDYLGGAD